VKILYIFHDAISAHEAHKRCCMSHSTYGGHIYGYIFQCAFHILTTNGDLLSIYFDRRKG